MTRKCRTHNPSALPTTTRTTLRTRCLSTADSLKARPPHASTCNCRTGCWCAHPALRLLMPHATCAYPAKMHPLRPPSSPPGAHGQHCGPRVERLRLVEEQQGRGRGLRVTAHNPVVRLKVLSCMTSAAVLNLWLAHMCSGKEPRHHSVLACPAWSSLYNDGVEMYCLARVRGHATVGPLLQVLHLVVEAVLQRGTRE